MRHHGLSALLLTLAMALPCAAAETPAGSGDVAEPTAGYTQARNELEAMLAKRDLDLYELQAEPVSFERIVIKEGTSGNRAYHAMVVRVINRTADTADRLAAMHKGYSQVMANITKEYEAAKVRTENGAVQLRVDGADGPIKDGLITERQESRARSRVVRLVAQVATEDVSRLTILTDFTDRAAQLSWERASKELRLARREGEIPTKPAERLAPHIIDPGESDQAVPVDDIRRALEEKYNRRLLTPGELGAMELGAYDGEKRVKVDDIQSPQYSMNGWYIGEAYVVFVFPNIAERARTITVRIDGLSNKMRRDARTPEAALGQKEDFFSRRYTRRAYVVQYNRKGDEFYRESDPIELVDHGWRWMPSFVRIDVREEVAHTNYILNNIRQGGSSEIADTKIADTQWTRYEALRQGSAVGEGEAPSDKNKERRQALPDLKSKPAASTP